MAPVRVPITTLQTISPGCPSAVVRDIPAGEASCRCCILQRVYQCMGSPIAVTNPFFLVNYKYVDETADIVRHSSLDQGCNLLSSPALASERRRSVASFNQQAFTESTVLSDTVGPKSPEFPFSPPRPDSNLAGNSPYALQLSPPSHSSLSSASSGFLQSSHPLPGSGGITHDLENGMANLDEHEACLMRYFILQLAPWVSFPVRPQQLL